MYLFSPTSGERFYNLADKDTWFNLGKIELTEKQVPSVTTVLSVWPKGDQFYKWLAQNESYESALSDRDSGGKRGTRVHNHIERMLSGEVLDYYSYKEQFFKGNDQGCYDEWKRLEAFVSWYQDHGSPTIVNRKNGKPAMECTLYSWESSYAGTTDVVMTGGEFGASRIMVDFKTGKDIYQSFWAQLAAYRNAWMEMGEGNIDGVGILLLGGINRKSYRFEICTDIEEIERLYVDFLACQQIWNRINRKSSIRNSVRSWGDVRSERVVYEVTEELSLSQPTHS